MSSLLTKRNSKCRKQILIGRAFELVADFLGLQIVFEFVSGRSLVQYISHGIVWFSGVCSTSWRWLESFHLLYFVSTLHRNAYIDLTWTWTPSVLIVFSFGRCMVDLELLRNASVEPCVDLEGRVETSNNRRSGETQTYANISGLEEVKSANLRTALHATIWNKEMINVDRSGVRIPYSQLTYETKKVNMKVKDRTGLVITNPMAAGTFAMIDMTGFKFNIMKIVASKLERKAIKK